MRCGALVFLILTTLAIAQKSSKPAPQPESKSATVPITLDHDRVVLDVDLPLPDGSTQRVHAWLDNGTPDLWMSRRVAELVGLTVKCEGRICSTNPPREMTIGSIKVSLAVLKEAFIELRPASAASVMVPGMNAEISIPSSILRSYDVIVNFPDHQFSIGPPGSLKFKGIKSKVMINPSNGLIQVPSKIENKSYNLGLDLGSSFSVLDGKLFDQLFASHPDRPHMTGAIGPANESGTDYETWQKLGRIERLQYGPLYLTDVAIGWIPGQFVMLAQEHAGVPTAGLLGSEALLNFRIGLDYAHSTVYFDIGRLFNFPDFDVIGLILRPEDDGRFTILGTADYNGKPSVNDVQAGDHLVAVDGIPVSGSTMGQVWSMLAREPGRERKLTVERGDKQFTIAAKVQHFLEEPEEDQAKKGRSKTH